MIRRVFKGRSPYGLVKYLYGEGRRNEHTDAHLIASWDGNPTKLEPRLDHYRNQHEVSDLVRRLEQPVKACDRLPEKWVYHLVLRNDETDRRLSDGEWGEVCTAAMDRTGIAPAGDTSGCRWIAVRHADDHVHLVATLAREDGRAPRVWNDYGQLAQVAHEYERKLGLRSSAGLDDHTANPRPGVKELATAEAMGRMEPPRVTLRQLVRSAAVTSNDFDQFSEQLQAAGVAVWARVSEKNAGQITGYSVSLDGWNNAAGEPVRFSGGKLAPDLTLPKLQSRWNSRTLSGWSITSEAQAATAWSDAEKTVLSAARRVSQDAVLRPDDAGDAAWAAADLHSAFASGVEGRAGGPLTDASDLFQRAGREQNRRTLVPSATGIALRAAGQSIALVASTSRRSDAEIAAMTAALITLAAAVEQLRRSQKRSHQAQAARQSRLHLGQLVPVSRYQTPTSRIAAEVAALTTGSSTGPLQLRPEAKQDAPTVPVAVTAKRRAGRGARPGR